MELSLYWGSSEWQERCEKGVLSATHPHIPFSCECHPAPLPLLCAFMLQIIEISLKTPTIPTGRSF